MFLLHPRYNELKIMEETFIKLIYEGIVSSYIIRFRGSNYSKTLIKER
jgi:hypothetical protein